LHYWQDYSDDALEKRWQRHLEREASFHGPPQEEVIQSWERCLRKAWKEDEDDGSDESSGSEESSISEDNSDMEYSLSQPDIQYY
jgi:hypothetical protein